MEEEKCFCVPADRIKDSPGFAFDIGGSLAKLVYIDKEKSNKDTKVIKAKIFSRNDIDSMIKFIQQNCHDITEQPVDVTVTGFGSFSNRKMFEEKLNVRLKVVDELGCFAKSVVYFIKNKNRKEVFHARDDEAEKLALQWAMAWASTTFEHMSLEDNVEVNKSESDNDRIEKQRRNIVDNPGEKLQFPCLVVMIGSAIGISMITEDGKHQIIDGSFNGGRTLLGLSHLLIGTRDFNEIMDLAEKGDYKGIDIIGSDLKKGGTHKNEVDKEDGLYFSYPDDITTYYLGKAADSDGPFKKEDIINSVWNQMAFSYAQLAHLVAREHGFKRIYFTGGVTNHPYSRRILEMYMSSRLTMHEKVKKDILYGFFKNGECFGALGALL